MRLGYNGVFGTMRARKISRKINAVFFVLFFVIIVLFSFFYMVNSFLPTILRVAEFEAKALAVKISEGVILDEFGKLNLSHDDIFTLEKNSDGKIVALTSNATNIAKIKSKISIKVQEKLSKTNSNIVHIPLGTLLGSDVFAGVGPFFRFSFMPIGASNVDIISEFSDSGINQTHLNVSFAVNTDIVLLMPGIKRLSKISCDVPVIDTVIVGDVPQSYVNVDREGYEFEDDVLQLAEE